MYGKNIKKRNNQNSKKINRGIYSGKKVQRVILRRAHGDGPIIFGFLKRGGCKANAWCNQKFVPRPI